MRKGAIVIFACKLFIVLGGDPEKGLYRISCIDTDAQATSMRQTQIKHIHGVNRARQLLSDPAVDQHDQDIIAVAVNRDRLAFARLFREFLPLVRAYCLKAYPGANSMADEVAQEVMIKVWEKAHTYKPEASALTTWLYTLTRNARIDYLRKNGRHISNIDPEPIWDTLEDEGANPFQLAQQRQFEQQIKDGLALLPAEQRQVLAKVYLEGATHQEVSETLNIPLGTVKSRVRLALKSLSIVVKR